MSYEPYKIILSLNVSIQAIDHGLLAIFSPRTFGLFSVTYFLSEHRNYIKPKKMLITTTNTVEGKKIVKYIGLVTGETIIGANIFKDLFAGIRDIVGGRSGSYEQVLREGKNTAVSEMQQYAASMGANAIIGVDLDYETVGHGGSMLMVTASGTAVILED